MTEWLTDLMLWDFGLNSVLVLLLLLLAFLCLVLISRMPLFHAFTNDAINYGCLQQQQQVFADSLLHAAIAAGWLHHRLCVLLFIVVVSVPLQQHVTLFSPVLFFSFVTHSSRNVLPSLSSVVLCPARRVHLFSFHPTSIYNQNFICWCLLELHSAS